MKTFSLSTLITLSALLFAAGSVARPSAEESPPPSASPDVAYVEAQLRRIMLVPESVEFARTVQVGPCEGVTYVTALLRQRDHLGRMGPFTRFVVAVTHPRALFYEPSLVLTYYEADSIGLVDDVRRKAYAACGGASSIPSLGLKELG